MPGGVQRGARPWRRANAKGGGCHARKHALHVTAAAPGCVPEQPVSKTTALDSGGEGGLGARRSDTDAVSRSLPRWAGPRTSACSLQVCVCVGGGGSSRLGRAQQRVRRRWQRLPTHTLASHACSLRCVRCRHRRLLLLLLLLLLRRRRRGKVRGRRRRCQPLAPPHQAMRGLVRCAGPAREGTPPTLIPQSGSSSSITNAAPTSSNPHAPALGRAPHPPRTPTCSAARPRRAPPRARAALAPHAPTRTLQAPCSTRPSRRGRAWVRAAGGWGVAREQVGAWVGWRAGRGGQPSWHCRPLASAPLPPTITATPCPT